MRHRRRAIGWVAMVVVGFTLNQRAAWGQDSKASEIIAKVLEKNSERQAALGGYTSERTYHIEYEGVGGEHEAQMEVHAEYRAPGIKHFTVTSESGSKAICEQVLRKMVTMEEESSKTENQVKLMISTDKYDSTLVGQEKVDGMDAWVLDVTPKPKEASRYTYRGRIWVSKDDYAIMRVTGQPAKNPSWLISRTEFDSKYERVGQFWLAAKNTTVSHVRLGGEATLTIDYGNYSVSPKVDRAMSAPLHGAVVGAAFR